jgi:16S rRNA G1207 methylase RsmC
MILCGGKNTGKRLVREAVERLQESGKAEIVALSVLSVDRVKAAGQKIANELGEKVEVIANPGTYTLNGVEREALIVTFTTMEGK